MGTGLSQGKEAAPSSAEFRGKVEQYLYSPSALSWLVPEWNLHFYLPSMCRSSNCLLPSCCSTKPLHALYLSPIHAPCPAHLILLDYITQKISGEEYRSLSSLLCSFLHSLVTLSLLGPNIFLSTLYSNTFSLCLYCNKNPFEVQCNWYSVNCIHLPPMLV